MARMRSIRFFIILLTALLVISPAEAQKTITFDDLFKNRTFSPNPLPGLRSMNDGKHYTMLVDGSQIVKYKYENGEKVAVLLDVRKVEDSPVNRFSAYEFSADETRILLTTSVDPIYRHSFTALYYLWNSVTEELMPLSEKGRQQLATFSPDGERVAFVRDNNLFIKNLKFGTESQVTFDGERNKVINGAPDWVYEEEFGFNKAFAWSPDSRFLAYIRFDESEVREFSMTLFQSGQPGKETSPAYPRVETFKYPRPGEKNSLVTVRIYDVRSKANILADTGKETDIYIPRIRWVPDGSSLAIMRMNRQQNRLDLLYVNPYTGDSRIVFTEKNDRFVDEDFLDKLTYLEDGQFVVTSERNGYAHLYLHDKDGFESRQLTNGQYDVTAFYGYDPVRKRFYYQAAESPMGREVCFVSSDGKKKGKLSAVSGTNRAAFSRNFSYYINEYTNLSTPMVTTVHDWTGKQIRILEDNSRLRQKLTEYRIPLKEFFSFTTSEGVVLNGWMIKPPATTPEGRFPVVITQYSGPNSQQVTDTWSVGWNEYLAQEGFLVVCVDPRGTGARGEDFRKVTYMQLGKYESDDMVETARYLARQPFVDAGNIAIWGWSYGGFMTALAMAKGGTLFKAGIAVAPVTNWRFYDNIYTERYMRTPEENPGGYDQNSPVTHADKITGRLLIVHGSADDNVHVQNTMTFAEALVQAGVPFDMAVYTDKNHGIRGGNTTMHLYRKMEDFLKNNLMNR